MKKSIAFLLILILLMNLLPGCGSSAPDTRGSRLHIVTTIFPVYDWVRQILDDSAEDTELVMLLDSGVDLHSYQPTATDIARISGCDLFIYVGGESDAWVTKALAQASNKDMVVINLMEALGDRAKEEEIVEGMQEEEEEDAEEGLELDEHVWLSLKNASLLCRSIAEGLGKADVENAAVYSANCDKYVEQLHSLDEDFSSVVEDSTIDTLVFGDRFPFRYLTDDYGLNYYAAFVGCSAESEASFETVVFLADKLDELGLKSILQIETANGELAGTIRDATASKNQQILTMNSLQSVTSAQAESGITYLSVMQENLNVLREALK